MSKFLNEKLGALSPYQPGEQPKTRYIKLNTNENPYFPSKYATARIGREALEQLRLYSDPDCTELNGVIAAYYGVNAENVLATNGSDEALAFCFAAFGGRGALFPDVTYGFYKVFAGLFGVAYEEVPLRADFTVDGSAYCGAGKLIVLANPNAQTGIALPLAEIERVVRENAQSVVVVDEAYVDFGGESAVGLTKTYENLVVVQTFSKSRSLAGARVGFAVADKGLIDDLTRVKFSFNPYNVNRLSQALAAEAMKDEVYFRECVARIVASRERLLAGLKALGLECLPSKANFVLARHGKMDGEGLYRALRGRGILVRHFDDERIEDYIRITVGREEDMQTLLAVLREILQ